MGLLNHVDYNKLAKIGTKNSSKFNKNHTSR